MPDSLKVIHIGPTPFFADRGCHIRIRNEIEALAGRGVRLILCTYHLGADVAGIDIRRSAAIPGYTRLDAGFSPYKFLADILLFFLVLKTAWRERPELLHGHLHEGALIGWAVRCCLFWRRLPLIMDMQGSLAGELVSYGTIAGSGPLAALVSGVERLICRLPRLCCCSSEKSRRLLTQRFGIAPERAVLLVDAVPDAFFAHRETGLRRQLGLDDACQVVVYTGSLLPGKGVGHVLEAIRALQHRPDLTFLLIGYPVEEVQAAIEGQGLSRVHLVGRVAYDALAGWLASADIAVDPKEEAAGEASGKMLHYMAAGLPVVCFDTVNNRAMLGDFGYYADEGGAALALAIERAAGERQEASRRGRAGRDLVQRRYSFDTIREVLLHHYRLLAGSGKGGG